MRLCFTAVLFLVACGPDSSGPIFVDVPPPSPPALDSRLSGAWEGGTSFAMERAPLRSFAHAMDVALRGTTALLSQVCPGGSGTLEVEGDGTAASWTGVFNCPPFATPECSRERLTIAALQMRLLEDGALQVDSVASADGCSEPRAVSMRFTGRRP